MNIVSSILNKVRNTVLKYSMLQAGDRVVVAVSGGPDSVCLLDVLDELKTDFDVDLLVAHYDHGLRPEEDHNETLFVKKLAKQYGLPFISEKARDLKPGLSSPEEKARVLRYEFLETVRKKFSAQKVAIGHNKDDQAETVLMRLMRGSGVSGLTGIPPVRDNIIVRPLIECGREKIISYLKQKRLKWMTDSSNLGTEYLRNKIRHEIMPLLRKSQPKIREILSQTAEILRKEDEWLVSEAKKRLDTLVVEKREGYISADLSKLMEVPDGLRPRIIREMIRIAKGDLRKITYLHINAVNELIWATKAQAKIQLPNGSIAKKTYQLLEIVKGEQSGEENFCLEIPKPGRFKLPWLNATILIEKIMASFEPPRLDESVWTGFFDASKVVFPLILRNFRPGDAFVPLGMKGHKKLKDFFIDLKIPSFYRKRVPVLLSDNKIIWVCGLRIDNRFKVESSTKEILRISFETATTDKGQTTPLP